MKKLLLLMLLSAASTNLFSFIVKHSTEQQNDHDITVTIPVTLEPHELINEQHILLSSDHPELTLKNWAIDKKPVLSFSPSHKEHVMVYDESFIITAHLKKKSEENQSSGNLHLVIASTTYPEAEETLIPIIIDSTLTQTDIQTAQSSFEHSSDVTSSYTQSSGTSFFSKFQNLSYKESIKNVLVETDSLLLRILLAFILGLLLSLTPCIYPMIPITVGVLQSQGKSSLLKNFFISLCYTTGLGTTFSLMGLLAASSGQAFGYLMVNPIFVVCIICFLAYFAFSLFGFYNLYIPRFLQNKGSSSGSGSALSAFFFGMASGSVASPCVSPGLALILTIVATLGNKFLGFLLLFAFGFGISTPLLILGTFSGSINMLPRAGSWMLEIQKIFGFMLLGMCLYYANNIIPFFVTMALVAGLCLFMGIHYFYAVTNSDTPLWKVIKNAIGLVAIVASVMTSFQAIEAWYHPQETLSFESTWYTDYQQALEQARATNKLLFIDAWTPYCSVCKGITNKLLKSEPVSAVLKEKYVILSVDASDKFKEPYRSVRDAYGINGVPYLVVVNPETETEITHWQSEMYDMSVEEVRKVLTDLSMTE